MSSLRKILSSRANGALSHGPITPLGKQHSSQNALRHGLLAGCVLLKTEPPENFQDLVDQHVERFQPADGVEQCMIEEMAAACWRMRRAWSIETRIIDNQVSPHPVADELDRMCTSFTGPEGGPPSLALLHRYETRLHLMYQRAMRNILLLRTLGTHNEPNPISAHPASPVTLAVLPPVLPQA